MNLLGVMIGSSLDGIDLAICAFDNNLVDYQLLETQEVPLDKAWKEQIIKLRSESNAIKLLEQNFEFGIYLGEKIKLFLKQSTHSVEMIILHGATVFHEPKKQFSYQLGSAAAVAQITGINTLGNLRQADMILGGQGAPFAPLVDELLFSEYSYCINLGGIANISFSYNNERVGYDICACNQVLNYYSDKLGYSYDNQGKIASSGKAVPELLDNYNAWPFLQQSQPKSLSNKEIKDYFIADYGDKYPIQDILRTFIEHIALSICNEIQDKSGDVLITGGGAFNDFLIERLRHNTEEINWIIPSKELVNYKECLLLCLMGYLFATNQANAYSSYTGASRNSIGGCLHKA